MTRCLTDLALERYLVGEPDSRDAGDHVRDCPRCRDVVAAKRAQGDAYMQSAEAREVARMIATAEHVADELEPPARRHRRGVRLAVTGGLVAIAAAVLIATLVWPREVDREAEVLGVTREWMDAYRHNDVAALDRILAEDYKFTDSVGHTSTKADDLATARSGIIHFDAYDTTDLHVRVWGDTAVVTGRSVIRGAARNGPFAHDFHFTDTLSRIDGRWQAVAAHVSHASK